MPRLGTLLDIVLRCCTATSFGYNYAGWLVFPGGFANLPKPAKKFMTKQHYVYKSFEEGGREYIGVRSCSCLPEEDIKYFGSFRDKTFKPTGKTILFVCETREEAMEIEIELHDFFDVAVNPQFANRAKAVSIGFDTTGVPRTEEHKKKLSVANSGKTHTEAQKKAQSKRMSGENHPMFGVPHTKETRKKQSESMSGENHPNYGNTGALNPGSKAIIVIKPDGTQRYYGSGCEAARDLGVAQSSLSGKYLKFGHVPKRGKFKDWQFVYESFLSENR